MKRFRSIVSLAVWICLGLYVTVVAMLHVPFVQGACGSFVASAIGQKLGTRVTVGRVDLGFLNRVIVDDVTIYDQRQKEMVRVARMSVKLDYLALANGRISISSAQLFGPRLALYKPSATADANFQFALDSLASKDTTKQTTLDVHVNSFIMRHGVVTYDRHDVPPVHGRFSTSHLHLSDINANIQLKVLRKDSINLNVRRFSFKEHSGLALNKLTFKLEGGSHRAQLDELQLQTQRSVLNIPQATFSYTLNDDGLDIKSLRFDCRTTDTRIVLADAASLVPQLANLSSPLQLSAHIYGTVDESHVSSLTVKCEDMPLSLKADGWYSRGHSVPTWHADISNLSLSQKALTLVYESLAPKGKEFPDILQRIGDISIKGQATSDERQTIKAQCRITTDVGKAEADVSHRADGHFAGNIVTKDFSLGKLLDNTDFGLANASVDFDGRHSDGKQPSLNAKAIISQFDYKGYSYNNIKVDGTYANNSLTAKADIADPNANIALDGSVTRQANNHVVSLSTDIRHLAPAALKLTNKWGDAVFSAQLQTNFTLSNNETPEGYVDINNLTMSSSADSYHLENLDFVSGVADNRCYFTLNSDFGHAEMVGYFSIKTLLASFTNFVSFRLPTLPGLPPRQDGVENECLLRAHITDTEWLRKFFGVPLSISKPLTLNGKVDDEEQYLYLNCVAPELTYDGATYRNVAVALTTPGDDLHCGVQLEKLLDNGDRLNLNLTARASDDLISTSLTFSNAKGKLVNGQINAEAQLSEPIAGHKEAHVDVQQSYFDIDGAKWVVKPSSMVYTDRRLVVDGFAISHGQQHIMIDGTASAHAHDSLTVDLNGVEVAYILNLVNFHAVDFDGQASGRAYVKAPFGDPAAEGRFKISNFQFEHGDLGTLDAQVEWNKQEKQIDIHGTADDGPLHRLLIDGYVSPSRSYIDLGMTALGTRLEFMRSFTSSFSNDIDGTAVGNVRLVGPMSNLNLEGQLVVDGSATITPLNCRYTLKGDTVTFVPDDIRFSNITIYDDYGNRGTVNGALHHRHLTNMTYDLDVKAKNLLVYDFRDFGDDTFYGTVFGTGNVDIHGRSGELTMNVAITPEKNSVFVYNVSNPDAISSQEFIHFTSHTEESSADAPLERVVERLPGTDVRLNFALDVTPEATMKLLMDSRTNDYITLNGHGTMRASYYNRGSFNMFGTYTVDHGTYGITIQDIIHKNFTFREGGTIVFGGNPFDAALNLQAVYTVNGVSLSDLNIGNSFSNNTIRVNCLMNIGGQARQPQVDFDIDMPTVSTDEKQMVRSVLNSEDEMNQQVLYLLGIGRFYPQGNNNATAQDEKQQSQTALAMQSLLSGTISSQINSLLGTVVNNNNWNFGANISTGDEGWNNAEYEGLLSGRLLNNRLLFNGQFGYRDNANTATTSFIGDFDLRYLLLPNGNLALKVYNQTNDRYFTKSSLNTQGIGIIMKKDFTNLRDLIKF